MAYQERLWRRPLVRVSLLALSVAAAPLPALAGEAAAPASSPPTIAAAATKAVAAEALIAASTPPQARAQSTTGTRADLASKSFFKTPAGIIALVAAGVGVGLTIYSTSNDRVKSPAK